MNSVPLRQTLPSVTIGLPVFNGETYIASAIESVLSQSFGNFELVICDNASTDGTPDICRAFASRDARLRYLRNDHNLGAAPNYNRTFELARGTFFKWLAHDDVLLPSYLERTLEGLLETPDAVICSSKVEYMNSEGRTIGTYDSALDTGAGLRPSTRFSQVVLSSHSCVDFFGLMRTSAMTDSLLHGSYHGADRAFLAQMALRGRIVHIPECLIRIREHHDRYTRTQLRPKDRLAWHDSGVTSRFYLPTWQLYRTYLTVLRSADLSPQERWRCRGVLARWWLRNWNGVRLAVDAAALVSPNVVGSAERIKRRWFGAAPGHFREDSPENDS